MTIEDIMAEADSAIDSEEGKEPEEEQQETLESLMAQADKQIEKESPAPSRLLAPEPVSELDALQAKAPTPKPQKEEAPPEDAVDLLLQMTQGQTPDQYDEKVFQWRDTLTPKQFSKLSKQDPTFPMTDTQERAAYDYLRKNEDPFKIPRSFEDWYGIAEYTGGIIPMVGEQVKDSAVGFVKGGYKFGSGLLDYATAENYAWKDAYETLPDDAKERVREQLGSIPGGFFNPKALADAEISKIVFSELPQEEQKKFEEQSAAGTEAGRTAMFSVLEPLVGLPISMAETATKVATGGTSIWDKITETTGARSYEDSFENWRNRRQFDGSMQRWNAERPTSYAKFLEVISPAIVSIAKLDGPNVEDYMREEGLTREEAELARDYDVEQRVLASINQVQEGIPDIDEDQRIFGEFALPGGFGLDQFGYAMNVMRVGSWMTPKLYAKLKLAGKTPEEINEYYTARTNAAKESAKKQLERRSKPTVAGKVAGKAADQIERIQAAMNQSAFWKRIRQASPYIAGGAVGYGITEDPLAFLYGPIAGRLATSFPRFISDWDEARRISAGGRQGTFATLAEIRQDRANASRGKPFDPEAKPEIKLKGSISERIQDYGGEKVDNILGNIGDYLRMGVEPTLIGIGVGAINSSDDEELASMIGNGLFFSLGGRGVKQIQNKIFGGYDPVIEGRKLRQDMVDLQKLYRDSSPESRKQIDRLSDWNTVVAAKEREVAAAQKRLKEAQANAEKAAAGDPTRFRTPADTIAEVGAASDKVVAAKKALELRQATLDRVSRANEQTRNEYSRQWLRNLARINMLGNGTLREGMNNVGINVLSSAEIYKIMRRNPENASISNEALWQSATQSGFHSSPDGTTVFKPGSPLNEQGGKMTFDSKRPSIVVNADYIRQTAGQTGQIPIFALNHEFGHHLKNVPEYAELIRDSESMLFAQEVKDLSGNTVAVTPGKYSQSDLVDMYWNRYLSGYTRAEKTQFAQMNGLLDETTGQLKPEETAAYMRNEVMADLTAESVSRFIDPQKDGAIKDIYDRALLKFRTKKLANLVDKLRRLGGTGDVISDNTGAELSPEIVQTATDALKAYDALKNQVSPAVPQAERPKISRAQIMRDRSLLSRYGADSPLFSTSVKAQVFDANGRPIGTSIPIDMKDPALSEGVWERTETGVRQIGGYGRISRQIDLAGVPVGSRIVISNQIDFQPDGVTPVVLKPKEAKKRGQNRAQIIRAALDNTPDYGSPNRFQPVAPGSDTYRGTFTPLQIKALMDIPESVVPKSIKDRILAFNQALARNDGTRMIVDYAAVMTDSGKYQAFSPKVYDVVPIGMMFSKDGNFLATTISVTRLFDKLNAWSERMPARLDFWNGSKDRFWDDFSKKYLANWQKGIEGSGYTKKGELVEGSIPLDADAEIAQQKANIFNDFLNLFDNATEGLNPDRTETPRRKGDPKDKNIDRTIMSMRIDHIAEIMENPMGKLPIIYVYAKQNYLPKPKIKSVGVAAKTAEQQARKSGFNSPMVFHGSQSGSITSFSKEKLGSNTGAGSAKEGFFFAGKEKTSQAYTGPKLNVNDPDGFGEMLTWTDLMPDWESSYDNDGLPYVSIPNESWKLTPPKEVAAALNIDQVLGEQFNTLQLDADMAFIDDLRSGKKIDWKKSFGSKDEFDETKKLVKELTDEEFAKLKDYYEDIVARREYEYDSVADLHPFYGGPDIPAAEDILKLAAERGQFSATGLDGVYTIQPDGKDFVLKYKDETVDVANNIDDLKEAATNHANNYLEEISTDSSGGKIYKTYLKYENPLVHDYKGAAYREESYYSVIQRAKKGGHDAVILKNTYDGGPQDTVYIVFNPEQIKSADETTYNDRGKAIPLSKRFDSGSTDIRFLPKRKALVIPEENARFMELAKNPEENQKQLRQMVDDVASDAQYYGPLYHQTRSSEPFSEFDNIVEGGVKGIYAADIEHIESRERDDTPYGDSEIEVYVKINNPLTENDLGFYKGDQGEKRTLGNVVSSPYDPKWIARMQSKGYDGIVWDGPSGMGQIVVAFDSSQIKKADPVTYDDQGNVIPLSQRFQSASRDIRYLPRKKIEGDEMPFKVVTQNRDPVLQQAAQRLIRGEIDTAEYQDLVRERSPYEDLPEVPEPMTTEAMKAAIAGQSRKAKVGIVRDVLKQNDEAESRIDIKAFDDFGEYVSTIHKPTKKDVGGEAATPIAHESTVHLKDVKFMVNPTQSLMIAAGRNKGTIARINGKWQDTTPEGAFELANEKFNDPEWIQLGMNPTRQSNFYIRSTGEPVKSADEVIQVGKFVLAKNPKKVTPDEMPERTMTDYGMQFLPRPKKADEGERRVPALSGVEPPVRFVGPRNTALEGVTLEYEPEAKPLTGISFLPRPKTDRYKFSFTVASDRIKLVDDLIKAKDWQGIRDLNQATVRHAMSDLRGVNYTIKDVLGAFENGREVSALVEVNTPDPEMVAEVRKRMVALGELWKQTEVLEEKVGMGDQDLLGTVDNDGFLHITKHELDLDKLTSRMVEKARLAAGIQSMTIDGNQVIFYDTDNIGTGFAKRVGAFADSIAEQGGIVRGSSTDDAAVRSYRDPESVKAGSLYYTDDPVQLFGAGQLPDRLRSPVYRVVSELLGRPLPPPKDGKRSYFTKEDVTPKQVKLQTAIGNTQDRVVLNDRKNKDVVKAYEELNSELIKQYDALVAAGMRFEALNDYDAYSKIYPNSSAVIKDIRNNNQLMFLKTNPQTFGPMKDGKPMDFSFHPLLKDSGRTDSSGNKLNYNDILRVVHDAIAHGTYSVEFGPIGEESAWHTHIRTIDNPWARWALTMETRGQNSFVNYRDARIGKDKMPLKPGDNGYVPIPDRDYAEQKFALIPLKYSLTGDAKVDKPVKELMAQLGKKRAEGSAEKQPDWMPSKAEAKQVLSKVPQPAGDPKTMVADATAVMGKPTKADEASSVPVIVSKEWKKKKESRPEYEGIDDDDDGDTITVGEAQLKDVVKYELTGLPIVVRPLPNYAAENNATKVAKNVLKIAERPEQYKEYSDRVVAAGEKVRNDPQRFTTLSGYLEFMRESGASGNLLMPPTQLVELVKNAQSILNLWNGGYHGAKTAPGTVKAAKEGLDGVNEMKSLMTENGVNLGPTPMITALHHLWGILSRQLDPLNQEGMWMRLVSQPSVLKQIQRSIDGEYNLSREQWKEIVQRARRNTKGQYDKIGNNATANANSFALMLERHNGKWDQLASIYRLDDPVAMTNAFWGLNVGPTGIKNKVQRFIGLTFGIHGSVLDRWRFVSLNLPMAMKLTGKPIPESYFKYYGRNKTIPEDPVGIYKSYGTVENGNPVYSTALYTGIDRTIEGVIANSPDIRNFLGVHATPGGFHWVDWNTVKNEAVGHSSLDLTKEFLKQKGRDATVEDFLDVVQNSTVYTRADQDGKILDLVMENGVFRIRED